MDSKTSQSNSRRPDKGFISHGMVHFMLKRYIMSQDSKNDEDSQHAERITDRLLELWLRVQDLDKDQTSPQFDILYEKIFNVLATKKLSRVTIQKVRGHISLYTSMRLDYQLRVDPRRSTHPRYHEWNAHRTPRC